MGLFKLDSTPLTSLQVTSGRTYYLKIENNSNEILMNILNATQFFNLTDTEIKIFNDDSFSSFTVFKCDKFYWYNQNKTQLKYDHILSNGNVIVFNCMNSGTLIFSNSNVKIKKYNIVLAQKKNLGDGSLEIKKKYLYKATGTSLSPDINGLRFYDSGLIQEGQPIYYDETNTYKLYFPNLFPYYWILELRTGSSGGWYVQQLQSPLSVTGTYNGLNGWLGTVTISSI